MRLIWALIVTYLLSCFVGFALAEGPDKQLAYIKLLETQRDSLQAQVLACRVQQQIAQAPTPQQVEAAMNDYAHASGCEPKLMDWTGKPPICKP
jgi:hypothetical protein